MLGYEAFESLGCYVTIHDNYFVMENNDAKAKFNHKDKVVNFISKTKNIKPMLNATIKMAKDLGWKDWQFR